MPFENEHSARLIHPPKKYLRVGRTHGSKDGTVQGVKIPSTIDIIWYVVKKDDKEIPIAQALRFPIKNWTAAEAKKWLKNNNIKYILFEPASGKKEKHSANIWDGQDNVPISTCRFICDDAVHFADGSSDEKKSVRLAGYRGDIINHWFWGNLAFDMDGLYFEKKKTPGLIDHNTSLRLTFSQKKEIKPEVFIEGPFLSNSDSAKLKQDMIEGFPFQASLLLHPEIVEQVADGQKVEVNGKILKGPGAIFRKAAILEISACVRGIFTNTEATALSQIDNDKALKFNLIKETNIMIEEQLTIETAEQFAEQYPAIHQEVFDAGKAEGRKDEREGFAKLKEVCGEDYELLMLCYSEAKTAQEAQRMKIEKLQKQNLKLSEDLKKAQQSRIDPATQEFSDDQASKKNQGTFDETAASDEQLKEHFNVTPDLKDQFSCAEAYIAAVRHPAKT